MSVSLPDVKKMPLGKLSKQQIAKGFEALEALEEALKKQRPSQKKLEELSSRFYTIIPHNFGRNRPPSINTQEVIQAKKDMLLVRSSQKGTNLHILSCFKSSLGNISIQILCG